MALRALLVFGLARQTRQQGKEEDPNILGRIELETTQVEPVNVRALCFEVWGSSWGRPIVQCWIPGRVRSRFQRGDLGRR